MSKRVIDHDPTSGITTWFDYDPATDMTFVGREQDVQAALDANKRLAGDGQYTKDGMKNDWWHYSFIPNIVIEKWRNEFGVNVYDKNHAKAVYKLLNSPDWRYLKTTTKTHMPR